MRNNGDWEGLVDHRPQEELHEDVARVCELACRNLSPSDQDLLRWACGVTKHEVDSRQMAVWDGVSEPF